MNTPSAGALRAAEAIFGVHAAVAQDRVRIMASRIDRESGLAELIRGFEILRDILEQDQPGIPPLPVEWKDVLKRHIRAALDKTTKPKQHNPNEAYEDRSLG